MSIAASRQLIQVPAIDVRKCYSDESATRRSSYEGMNPSSAVYAGTGEATH